MYLSPSGIGYIIDCLICLLFFLRLYQSWQKTKTPEIEYFMKTFLWLAVSFLFYGLPVIIFNANTLIVGIGIIIGNFFVALSLAYLIKLCLSLKNFGISAKTAFYIMIIWGIIHVILRIIFYQAPIIDANYFVDLNPHLIVGINYICLIGVTVLITAYTFISEGLRESHMRLRSFCLAGGSIIMFSSAFIKVVARLVITVVLSDILLLLGCLLIFIGLVYKKSKKQLSNEPT